MKNLVAPSLLAADFYQLHKAVELIENSDADWYHLDVMDGVFVPNISFGLPILESLKKHTTKLFDSHLMIVNPDPYIEPFKQAGTDLLTVHYEACTHLHRTVAQIKKTGMKAGVALNPHTPINVLEDILPELDLVLIMSVNPGFGGQSFIENTYKKVSTLKEQILKHNLQCLIEIDGGVCGSNAVQLVEAGADVLVAGSYVFGAENPQEAVKSIKF